MTIIDFHNSLFHDVHTLSSASANQQNQPEVSYNLIRSLHARLVHFITRLVVRVLILKDKEKRQKRRIKALFPEEVNFSQLSPIAAHNQTICYYLDNA
jgi:hypothetical protein